MPVEAVRLTARFKVNLTDVEEAVISEIYRLFEEYQKIVNELIEYAHSRGITSPRILWYAKYHELRQKYPTIPSHYIYTACRLAASIYKSFIGMRKLRMCKGGKPTFKGQLIWLDDHLFKLDVKGWRISIAAHEGGWIALRLLHGRYHDKFRGMMPSEARLVLKEDGNLYLNVAFHQKVNLPEISAEAKVVAVDVNENTIVYGNDDFVERFETDEGIIRTRYFLKRRRIQSRIRGRQLRKEVLEKYRGREWRRIREIYYKAAKEIISRAKEIGATAIVIEDLEVYKKSVGSRELNGRLHRWSYGRFQQILEYQAKLHGINVKCVDPRNTSRTCPVCGSKLSLNPNRCRLMRCKRCGLEEDRDVIAVKNLTHRYYKECMSIENLQNSLNCCQIDVGSSRSPRKPSNEMRREDPASWKLTLGQNATLI